MNDRLLEVHLDSRSSCWRPWLGVAERIQVGTDLNGVDGDL